MKAVQKNIRSGRIQAAFYAVIIALSCLVGSEMQLKAQETAAPAGSIVAQNETGMTEQIDEEIQYAPAPGEGREGLHLDKRILPQGNGVYTVMLEAYTDSRTVSFSYEKPADYYLVLDVSTSMSYFDFPGSPEGKRLGALKNAAIGFIEEAAARFPGAPEEEQNRAAVIQFSDPEHSGVVSGLTALTAEGVQQLQAAIEGLTCSHLTRTDLGMLYTEQLIAADNSDRDKIVILVTDGQPNNQDGFQPSVANSALACAARLKEAGVRIYAVSIENHAQVSAGAPLPEYEKNPAADADPSFLYMFEEVSYEGGPEINTTNENAYAMTDRFMHLISSNNPRALTMDLPDGSDPSAQGRTIAEDGTCYYMTAADTGSLSQVFSELSGSGSRTEYDPKLTIDAQLRDIVAKDFKVKEGGEIHTYFAERRDFSPGTNTASNSDDNAGSSSLSADESEWGEYQEIGLNVITSQDSVKVSGFDYRNKKLAVLFDIIRRPESTALGWTPTNAEISGVFENDSTEEALAYFPIPSVYLDEPEASDPGAVTEKPGPADETSQTNEPDPADGTAKTNEPGPADGTAPSENKDNTSNISVNEQKTDEKNQATEQTNQQNQSTGDIVINTVLQPQPVFEINTAVSSPVTISGNSSRSSSDTNNPVTVSGNTIRNKEGNSSAAVNAAGTSGQQEKGSGKTTAPLVYAVNSKGTEGGTAAAGTVSGKADRPLPVTADDSSNGMWLLLLAAIGAVFPAIFYAMRFSG